MIPVKRYGIFGGPPFYQFFGVVKVEVPGTGMLDIGRYPRNGDFVAVQIREGLRIIMIDVIAEGNG